MTDTPNDNESGTIRAGGEVIPAGIAPQTNGTQRDDSPVISSGVPPTALSGVIIPAGTAAGSSGEIILNDKRYKLLKTIARSTGEAEVYLVESSGEMFVFKYYYPKFQPKETILKQLKGLRHEDLVALIDYGYYQERFFELLEYAVGGTLADVDDAGRHKYLPIKDVERLKKIIRETVSALNFCHSKGIVHRDIKPGNIFFRNPVGDDVLVGDFGISSMLEEGFSKHATGLSRTNVYAAPEIYHSVLGKTYISKEVDYYALGITLLYVWTGEEPFKELSDLAAMHVKCNGKVPLPDDMPEEIMTLAKGLITVDPSKRWGYDEVRRWLNGEQVLVHYESGVVKYGNFIFGVVNSENLVVSEPAELAKLLEKHPEQGRKHLYKGTISKWLQDVDQALYLQIEEIVEDDYAQDENAGLVKAIYVLDPAKSFRTELGVDCTTAEQIGLAIEAEAAHYVAVLTQQKHPKLFLYMEARGGKNEANAFRKYAQTFNNPERAFNTIALELQGKDKFKNGEFSAEKPVDLLSADIATKALAAKALINDNSKLSLWLEQFTGYKTATDKLLLRKQIIGSIGDQDQPIVRRYNNEEKLVALLCGENAGKAAQEKATKIGDMVKDMSQRVAKRKTTAANAYYAQLDASHVTLFSGIGGVALVWAASTILADSNALDRMAAIPRWWMVLLCGVAWLLGKTACSIWSDILVGGTGSTLSDEREYAAKVSALEGDIDGKASEADVKIRNAVLMMPDREIMEGIKQHVSAARNASSPVPTRAEIEKGLPKLQSGPDNPSITWFYTFTHVKVPALLIIAAMVMVLERHYSPVFEVRYQSQPQPDAHKVSSSQSAKPSPPKEPSNIPVRIDWVRIPGGNFNMGSESSDDEKPIHRVTVATFDLARTEVTVEQYGRCVSAGRCSAPGPGSNCNWGVSGREQHPVNCVDWEQVKVFAQWAGGRLPTEAEWEYAARSGGQDWKYPWGEAEANCDRAVMSYGGNGCGRDSTGPVCSKPAGNTKQGLCDMSGNVWEWTQDWWHASYKDAPSDGSAWEDPPGSFRGGRGGSWNNYAGDIRATRRGFSSLRVGANWLGLRLARSVSPAKVKRTSSRQRLRQGKRIKTRSQQKRKKAP